MLADGLRQLLERAAAIEPTESDQSVCSTLLRLAWEVEADHEEARVYHDEIERLHRDVHATVTAMRGEWERMTRQPSPDERQVASEQIAACRAEIATLRQEIARYRDLLVISLARVQRNCRRIRVLSMEHGLMTVPDPPPPWRRSSPLRGKARCDRRLRCRPSTLSSPPAAGARSWPARTSRPTQHPGRSDRACRARARRLRHVQGSDHLDSARGGPAAAPGRRDQRPVRLRASVPYA